MDWGKFYRIYYGLTNEVMTDEEIVSFEKIASKYDYGMSNIHDSTIDIMNFIVPIREQLNVQTVVEVLAVIATAVVGLVFMWWGVRKISAALMKAFRKGKISL